MELVLIITAVAAVISVSIRAMGPRPSGWQEPPETDLQSFKASFGIELFD